jgi:hypothetical protein
MERVWLLAIIDVCTRAVLGYHIAYSSRILPLRRDQDNRECP